MKLRNRIILIGLAYSVFLFSLTACNSTPATLPVSDTAPTQSTQSSAESGDLPTDVPPPPMTSVATLSDEAALQLMDLLLRQDSFQIQETITTIIESGDTRFIAVFLELLRAKQLGITNGSLEDYARALEALSGQKLGTNWAAWIEWYGATALTPPPGFTGWKGKILSEIDPKFAEFLHEEAATTIRVEEILWGGVSVDGIPALDNSPMVPASEAAYLDPGEPVFGLSINGDVRAYPLRILDWHEMANDVVGGVPVSLAYCTLCGAGIAYDGRATDGTTYTFGSSGFLFRSNKLMYDRQTRTLWNQLTGEPVLGPLVGTDVKLNLLPVVLTSWLDWETQHPDTLVLSRDTGYSRPYEPGAAYGDYFAAEKTMFPVWQRSDLLPTKSRVFALQLDGIPKAYPVETLIKEKVVNDQLGSVSLVVVATRGDLTVLGNSYRVGEVSYNAGGEVRAYERITGDALYTFSPGPEADTLLDGAGQRWQITEAALLGPDGLTLPRLPGHLAYWFGWYAFFPKTLIYGFTE